MLIGGLETGGTKMVAAVADDNGNILDRISIPTIGADETIGKLVDYFKDKNIEALGIAAFGPLELDKKKDNYGCLLKTPKEGWSGVNLIAPFKSILNVPVEIDTDVNGAVLGEVVYGAGKGLENVIYYTIGTGIGAGVYLNGKLHHGVLHPESGHMLMRKAKGDDFEGVCPFHKGCFEGLASGPAINKRWGANAKELYDNEKVWEIESYYIGQALVSTILMYAPERIILGGGVMNNEALFTMIRKQVLEQLSGYFQSGLVTEDIDNYIVPTGCNGNAGILGAIELAKIAKKYV